LAQTVFTPVLKCLSCQEIRFEKSERCPVCGGRMRTLNEKKAEFS
jgi:rRNA maturation endonuclease Nob1